MPLAAGVQLSAVAQSPAPVGSSAPGHRGGVAERERRMPVLITKMRLSALQVNKSTSELENLHDGF